MGGHRITAIQHRTASRRCEVDFEELPDILTVEEMAKAFRLGRSQAYELTKRYRLTGGKEGIPVLQLGRRLRVPKAALRKLLDTLPTPENLK
jgi:Helix-turn-helix domain